MRLMKEDDLIEILRKQFGVEKIPFKIKSLGKGKIYAFMPCFLEIEEHHSGIYFGKIEKDGFRLSIEGCYLLGDLIKRNIKEVKYDDMLKWLRGEDIEGREVGYVILKWRGYFLGCGKGNGKFIRNFVPKNRRIRS